MCAELQRGCEQSGGVDVSVAVDLAVTQKFGVFESGNQAEHARLFGEAHVILKAHQVVAFGAKILLAKLDHRVGPAAGSWIGQAHRLHGTEAQCLAAAAGELFDGQAGFEERRLIFRDVGGNGFRGEKSIDEALILFAIERAIQIIVGGIERFAVARSPERDARVDGSRVDDGADGIVEEQALGAGDASDLFGECAAGEGSGGDDGDGVFGN